MKTILYKSLTILFFLCPLAMVAHNPELKGRYTKEKTIKKDYNVNSDAILKITNSYGNLNITSWNENRVLIEVHVTTSGNNEDKVQEKLDNITVDFEASNSMVYAKTIFNQNRSGWGFNWSNNNVNMQINYTVKVPVKNSVHLNNDYGNISLDRIDGHAKIKCDYGRLDIGELRGRNNELRFDYTSKSNFGYINSAEINADYSGFTIEKAGNLNIRADYTNGHIVEMENLDYASDYGSLEIDKVKNIEGNGDYINVKIGDVYGNIKISADYGSIRITDLTAKAGNVELSTNYTGVKIGYSPDYHFNFEITTDYASVSGKDDFEIHISKEKSSEKYYQGYHGTENSGKHLTISSSYGGVSFSKN